MKNIFTICCLCCGVLLASCNHWLDLEPYGEVEEHKMFEEEQGFIQTLTGSYLLLTDASAYGCELTTGYVEQIVHNWKKQNEFYDFKYTNTTERGMLDATWSKMYEAIANTNLLLQNLKGKHPEDFENYNLIKGEALGLRAYLHLDLLRLFGPVLKDGGMEQKAIPYREEFSNQVVKLMTASEVLRCIRRDLDSAYVLLQDDPIKVYGRDPHKNATEEITIPEVKGLAMSFRGSHLNYYAVCAALARVCMLTGDDANASKYAEEVIGSGLFELVLPKDVAALDGVDAMFERELVWSLFDPKINEHIALRTDSKALDSEWLDYVYKREESYGDIKDFRYANWFNKNTGTPTFWYMKKYERTLSVDLKKDNTPWRTTVPMIRLSEMYYIAAEANLETDPEESYRLLNIVRRSRSLADLPANIQTNATALRDQLIYECQKDFWGEGKLFYFYKRNFLDINTKTDRIKAVREIYELPVPQNEIEYGDNNN